MNKLDEAVPMGGCKMEREREREIKKSKRKKMSGLSRFGR